MTNRIADLQPNSNGQASKATKQTRKPAAKATAKPSTISLPYGWTTVKGKTKIRWATVKTARILAAMVGAVIVGLLGLSLEHCAAALAFLTRSEVDHMWYLAMAIDCGLCLAELGEQKGPEEAHSTCTLVVIVSIGLSMLLNVVAFGMTTKPEWSWSCTLTYAADLILGITIPGLVFLLCRIMSKLAK